MAKVGVCGEVRSGFVLLALLLAGCGSQVPADGAATRPSVEPSKDQQASAGTQVPSESKDEWLASIETAISNGEYRFQPDAQAQVHATNRAHDLRGSFSSAGLYLASRLHPERGSLHLNFTSWGREARTTAVHEVTPGLGKCTAGGRLDETGACLQRLELVRAGITEYWDNLPNGLEQGWEIAERPTGEGALVLNVHVAGAKLVGSPGGVTFETEGGFRVAYNGVKAWDSDHHALVANLSFAEVGQLVTLRVEDTDAKYPITVDPTLTQPSWSYLGSDHGAQGNDGGLGWAMAGGDVNGDGYTDLVVGAPWTNVGIVQAQGKAFCFLGSASGLSSTASWSATFYRDDYGDEEYGEAVAVADFNGDGIADVAVGEPRAYSSTGPSTPFYKGAVHLFLGSAGGLPASPTQTVYGDTEFGEFGGTLSAGDLTGDGKADLLVGAPLTNYAGIHEGAAYVFRGTASGLEQSYVWSDRGSNSNDQFGLSLAVVGDVNADGYADFVVASPGWGGKGQAYAYTGSSTGAFTYVKSWRGATSQRLGSAVAAVGDMNQDGYADFMIGNSGYDGSGLTDNGKVLWFAGSATAFGLAGTDWVIGGYGDALGSAITGLGDINGDGYPDVALGVPQKREMRIYLGNHNVSAGPSFGNRSAPSAGSHALDLGVAA